MLELNNQSIGPSLNSSREEAPKNATNWCGHFINRLFESLNALCKKIADLWKFISDFFTFSKDPSKDLVKSVKYNPAPEEQVPLEIQDLSNARAVGVEANKVHSATNSTAENQLPSNKITSPVNPTKSLSQNQTKILSNSNPATQSITPFSEILPSDSPPLLPSESPKTLPSDVELMKKLNYNPEISTKLAEKLAEIPIGEHEIIMTVTEEILKHAPNDYKVEEFEKLFNKIIGIPPKDRHSVVLHTLSIIKGSDFYWNSYDKSINCFSLNIYKSVPTCGLHELLRSLTYCPPEKREGIAIILKKFITSISFQVELIGDELEILKKKSVDELKLFDQVTEIASPLFSNSNPYSIKLNFDLVFTLIRIDSEKRLPIITAIQSLNLENSNEDFALFASLRINNFLKKNSYEEFNKILVFACKLFENSDDQITSKAKLYFIERMLLVPKEDRKQVTEIIKWMEPFIEVPDYEDDISNIIKVAKKIAITVNPLNELNKEEIFASIESLISENTPIKRHFAPKGLNKLVTQFVEAKPTEIKKLIETSHKLLSIMNHNPIEFSDFSDLISAINSLPADKLEQAFNDAHALCVNQLQNDIHMHCKVAAFIIESPKEQSEIKALAAIFSQDKFHYRLNKHFIPMLTLASSKLSEGATPEEITISISQYLKENSLH